MAKHIRGFASDNNSGAHPKVLEALALVNKGHQVGYGDDPYSEEAREKVNKLFGGKAEVFFVFGGTGANVVSIQSAAHSFEAVICAKTAHINEDECGAPEKISGSKLLTLEPVDGKITPQQILPLLHSVGFEHHVQPKLISITQATELGTVYSSGEISALADFAHKHNMFLHIDGARLTNAAAHLDISLREMTKDCGVDIVSFGGTKNGMIFGEAVVFINRGLAKNFKYIRKQSMQLYSKMRFIAAQYNAMLENDLWLQTARHSNSMATLLEKKIKDIAELKVIYPVEANAVFVELPERIIKPLQEEFFFYVWDEEKHQVRWMTSFDTEEADIDDFVDIIKKMI